MSDLQVRLLGEFEIFDTTGQPIALSGRKTRALLGFLLVESERWHSRDRLIGLFWGDRAETQARNSLNQALYEIRKTEAEVGTSLIERKADRVRCNSQGLETDHNIFVSRIVEDPLSAAELRIGELLEGLEDAGPEFADWLDTKRASINTMWIAALNELVASEVESSDADRKIAASRQLLVLDPFDESALRSLMLLLARKGRRAEAIREFQSFAKALKKELGIEPEEATRGVLSQVQCSALLPDDNRLGTLPTRQKMEVVLSISVVNFDRMYSEDPTGTASSVKAHRNAIDPIVLSHGGRTLKSDSGRLIVGFSNAVDAVNSAIAIQTTAAERNAILPDDRRFVLRVGVSPADVFNDDDTVSDAGIFTAVAIEQTAAAGGIQLHALIYEAAKNNIDTVCLRAAPIKIEGSTDQVDVWRIDMRDAEAKALAMAAVKIQTEHSAVAVLPFQNVSGDPEQEYFADGLTEDIISALAKQRELRVLARSSSFAYKGQAIEVRHVARELDARYILEGSIRKSGSRIRVTAQLVDGTSGLHAWSERYDRDLQDIFEVQDEITSSIVGCVAPQLMILEGNRARAKAVENLDAWDLYLQALWIFHQGKSSEEYIRAIELVRRASEIEPRDALPQLLLSKLLIRGLIGRWLRGSDVWAEAIAAAEVAVRLDDRNAEAHATLSNVYAYIGRHTHSVNAGRRAIELGPAIAYCHRALGNSMLFDGKLEEASEYLLYGLTLNPNSQENFTTYGLLAHAYYLLGKYEVALNWADQALLSNPNFAAAYGVRTATLAKLGLKAEASKSLNDFARHFPNKTISTLRPNYRWKNKADVDHFMDGLRKAGFPE